MILSTETKADIRRLHDIWLARLAFEYRCEQTDIAEAVQYEPETRAVRSGDFQREEAPAQPPSDTTGEAKRADQSSSPEEAGGPIPENAAATLQAGEVDASASPAPNQELAPPPLAVPASEPTGSDNAGGANAPQKAPPAPQKLTLFERVSAVHAEHPHWNARQIANHIGRPVNSVQTTLAVVRKAVAAEASPSKVYPITIKAPDGSLRDRVRFLHERQPSLTASLIAKELGANASSVSVYLAELRRKEGAATPPPAESKPEFAGRREMLNHYDEVAKRLGKAR